MEDARSKGLDVDELAYQNVCGRIKILENARMVQFSNLPTLTVPEIFTTVLALAEEGYSQPALQQVVISKMSSCDLHSQKKIKDWARSITLGPPAGPPWSVPLCLFSDCQAVDAESNTPKGEAFQEHWLGAVFSATFWAMMGSMDDVVHSRYEFGDIS